ncbi:MAG: hypothetical protein LBP75_07175 [Planctomycetota bacterium]|nr:hypothetical protein [Planctomycetota bacterium]
MLPINYAPCKGSAENFHCPYRAPAFFDNANPARRKIKEPIFLWAGLLCTAPAGRLAEF